MTDPISEAVAQAAEAGARRALAGHVPCLTRNRGEAAVMLGVSVTTVDAMTAKGELNRVVAGRITLASILKAAGWPLTPAPVAAPLSAVPTEQGAATTRRGMSGDPILDVISNDSGAMGARLDHLPPHTHDELLAAARLLLDSEWHVSDDCTPESIVADSRVVIYREHCAVTPGQAGCGCEDVGWYCEQGDGEPSAWLWLAS